MILFFYELLHSSQRQKSNDEGESSIYMTNRLSEAEK